MKHFNFWAFAMTAICMAACTSEDDLTIQSPPVENGTTEVPIMFSSSSNNFTRADFTGAEAAEKLGYKFVVSGYKGSQTTWNDASNKIVFDNYLVEYTENTAHTTESNTANWEYVGKTPIAHATANGIVAQTIKYWDYTTDQYDFFAWSTGDNEPIYSGTPSANKVLVSTIDYKNAKTAAYTFSGTADDLKDCYISDLVTVNRTNEPAAGYGEVGQGYGKTVTFKFRQLGTKVRIALYETIPGYSVKNVEFYSAANTSEKSAVAAKLFTTTANEIYTEGTYTVSFPTIDTPADVDNNQAHIAFSPNLPGSSDVISQKTTIDWGALEYTMAELGESSKEKKYLGRSSNTASFAGDAATNYYVTYLPNQNGTNLNLRVNYTLESIDGSKEEINVKGATAQVPLIYTQWKPGYAYTYLFKISDKTNGFTGAYDPTNPDAATVDSNPAGLYPITFDALVVDAEEDHEQQTITTVSAPSITTYQKGSNVVNSNEYVAATGAIFVTVNDGNAENTPDLANGKLVKLTATGDHSAALYTLPKNGKYTEADVIAALQTQDDDAAANTIKGRNQLVLTEAEFTLENSIEYGVDGNAIDLTKLTGYTEGNTPNAMKFTADATTADTYAFVYTKKAATGDPTPKYQAKTIAHGESVNGLYRYKLVPAPTPEVNTHTGDVEKGVTYFNAENASADAITPFIGQGVSNLYTRSGSDPNYVYTIATGYAQTGTKYYYTLDNGQTYKEAHNVAYAATDWLSGLYENNTTPGTYKETTDTEPASGKAYYFNDGGDYKYCVFLPQRTTGLYVIDKTEANITPCGASDVAVTGMTYFDKYTQNNGVYYVKVIKVQ